MPTELTPPQLVMLTQWLSPAFPVGAFSYAHGLEYAAQTGVDVEDWLAGVLRHGAGRGDAILIRAAHKGDAAAADDIGRALAPSKERALEADQQGRAFCKALRGAFAMQIEDRIYPVALGEAARMQALPPEPVVQMYLHSFTSNLIAAAQRLTALGQTPAQAMLHRLGTVCGEVAHATQGAGLDDLGGSAWGADVASMRHEDMRSRIFRT